MKPGFLCGHFESHGASAMMHFTSSFISSDLVRPNMIDARPPIECPWITIGKFGCFSLHNEIILIVSSTISSTVHDVRAPGDFPQPI